MREHRIELLPVEVVNGNSMTGFPEHGCCLTGYRVVERARAGMGEDDGDLHGPSGYFRAVALKNV